MARGRYISSLNCYRKQIGRIMQYYRFKSRRNQKTNNGYFYFNIFITNTQTVVYL